jgi:hypothetical protein
MIAGAAFVAMGPYVLAEALTGFGNTRAILGYLGSSGAQDTGSATRSLVIGLDPTGLLQWIGFGFVPLVIAGTAMSIAAISVVRSERVVLWLTVSALAGIAGQTLFFWWMSRPFAGYHHVTLLTPFYAVVPAVLIRRAAFQPPVSPRTACALGLAVLVFVAWRGPSLADRNVERTPWSYARIVAAVNALCGNAGVATEEGQGFAALLNPRYDSVLRYLMRRRLTTCRYESSSDVLLAAARDADYPATMQIGDRRYVRELVLPPGIARYRRDP